MKVVEWGSKVRGGIVILSWNNYIKIHNFWSTVTCWEREALRSISWSHLTEHGSYQKLLQHNFHLFIRRRGEYQHLAMNGTVGSSNLPQISPIGPDLSSSRQPLTHVCESWSCVKSLRPTNKVFLECLCETVIKADNCLKEEVADISRPWTLNELLLDDGSTCFLTLKVNTDVWSQLPSNGDADGGLVSFDACYLLNLNRFFFVFRK